MSSTNVNMPESPKHHVLIIGCGNLLRADDGLGPATIEALSKRSLPNHVDLLDASTRGIDIAFLMRGYALVIFVDTCQSGEPAGTILELGSEAVESLESRGNINLHTFRWDDAIAFARQAPNTELPTDLKVLLVEGESFEVGQPLSRPVKAAIPTIVSRILELLE